MGDYMSDEFIKTENLVACKTCGRQFSRNAKACPRCGEPSPARRGKYRWIFVLFGIAFVYGGVLCVAKGIQMQNIRSASSISTEYTTPAAILFCVGVFCAVAPFCRKR